MKIDRIHQVAAHARDLDESVKFYRDILGAECLAVYDRPGIAFFNFSGVRILLEKNGPKASVYFKVDDLDAVCAELKAKSIEMTDEPHLIFRDDTGTFGKQGQEEWMAFFKDPSGDTLAFASRK
ncbi:MAG: methylmalonyl-CoA epimerase [Spirochaetales bacterium]|nr:methylmalonyl-CoA epimerase [Spirochaetales bacterium]